MYRYIMFYIRLLRPYSNIYIHHNIYNLLLQDIFQLTTTGAFKSGKKDTRQSDSYVLMIIKQDISNRVYFILNKNNPHFLCLYNGSPFFRNPIMLTYDDPRTYKGPIVEGWPPSKNRTVKLYMEGICTSYIILR